MKKITILVPAYNEEESLPFLYERVSKIMNEVKDYEFELLFVNDGSKDNTLNEIKKLDGNIFLEIRINNKKQIGINRPNYNFSYKSKAISKYMNQEV